MAIEADRVASCKGHRARPLIKDSEQPLVARLGPPRRPLDNVARWQSPVGRGDGGDGGGGDHGGASLLPSFFQLFWWYLRRRVK